MGCGWRWRTAEAQSILLQKISDPANDRKCQTGGLGNKCSDRVRLDAGALIRRQPQRQLLGIHKGERLFRVGTADDPEQRFESGQLRALSR
jgi:hypothetical protein